VVVAGVADHRGWAVIVTVGRGGQIVDRRRARLVDSALPSSPFEHEAQALRLEDGIALVREVERSVDDHVRALWDALAAEHGVAAVAIRESPRVPTAIEEQIGSYHAQVRADSAMYLRLLVADAARRGWPVDRYDQRQVIDEATGTLDLAPEHLAAPRRELGPPWTIDHRRAFAAALLAQQDLAGEPA
jgi:hypothetical protein